jgi:hypothetical protein
LDCRIQRAGKFFKRKEQTESNHFNVCWFIIDINTYHLTFSKHLILIDKADYAFEESMSEKPLYSSALV